MSRAVTYYGARQSGKSIRPLREVQAHLMDGTYDITLIDPWQSATHMLTPETHEVLRRALAAPEAYERVEPRPRTDIFEELFGKMPSLKPIPWSDPHSDPLGDILRFTRLMQENYRGRIDI